VSAAGGGEAELLARLSGDLDPVAALLMEQAPAGVLIVDGQGRVLRANTRLRQMAGDPGWLVTGAPAMALFAPDEQAALWALLDALRRTGVKPDSMVARLMRPRGAPLVVELAPVALRSGAGETAAGLILYLTDLTPRHQLEAQLAQSQKMQAVGQLAAGIAHDFNNLLTAISGAAETISARQGGDAQTLQDATEICESVARGAALVRQLLAFGRQQALQPRVIAINAAIEALAGLLRRLLGQRVVLALDLPAPGGLACVDPTQLDQVLINLAVNARDAMPDGGTLTLRSGHITLYRPLVRGPETIPPGRYVMIEVQDSGIGIAADALPRIFEPFFTTRRERGGTGLGLSTVHGIIRQSRGFLGVESTLGQGTRMRVYLPRHEAAPEEAEPARISDRAPTMDQGGVHPQVVLLVDDEPLVCRLAERALTRAGWRVIVADSAEAALERAEALPRLSLLISDVIMPGLDGPWLAERLRAVWPRLPVLLVSGYVDEALRERVQAGRLEMLHKPYTLADLVAQAASLVAESATAG
jgi:two-component system cell cycle sensor histidine kinase/response regulator CckA